MPSQAIHPKNEGPVITHVEVLNPWVIFTTLYAQIGEQHNLNKQVEC